jgi:hypothetical protein
MHPPHLIRVAVVTLLALALLGLGLAAKAGHLHLAALGGSSLLRTAQAGTQQRSRPCQQDDNREEK